MNQKIFIGVVSVSVILLVAFYFITNKGNKVEDAAQKVIQETELIPAQKEQKTYTDIESKEAYEIIMSVSDLVILDVSPRFDKGHLPGAINYYVGDGSLDKAIPSLDKNRTYLVYCHVDSASIPGARKLIEAGFPDVYRLKGNYPAWIEGGYPIEVSIKAVENYSGNALASRSFLDGRFMHSIVANVSDPPQGKFYEGWLVKGESFFSTGKMLKKDDAYVLNYESEKDSRDYKNIVITEETEALGLDNKPEKHVFEGEFE